MCARDYKGSSTVALEAIRASPPSDAGDIVPHSTWNIACAYLLFWVSFYKMYHYVCCSVRSIVRSNACADIAALSSSPLDMSKVSAGSSAVEEACGIKMKLSNTSSCRLQLWLSYSIFFYSTLTHIRAGWTHFVRWRYIY